jgi:hypothetical protein
MPRLLQLLLFLLIQTAHFRRSRFVENLGLQQQFCVLDRAPSQFPLQEQGNSHSDDHRLFSAHTLGLVVDKHIGI